MDTITSGMIVMETVKNGIIAAIHRTRKLHTVHALGRTRFIAGLALAILLTQPAARGAEAPVSLGTADTFAVLAGAGITVANAVKTTKITGDIGTFPTPSITGLGNVTLNGVNHADDAVTQKAKDDLVTAYNDAAGRSATHTYGPIFDLGGQTLTPGVYNDPSSFGITGTLTLDAQNDPNAVWIFQAGSTLITASGSSVKLLNGAQACHVFWQVGVSATLGTDSDFVGDILAFTDITLTTGATVDGRVLARNGAVTLDNNTLAMSVCPRLPVAPVINWAQPADITYGTALGTSQLNATASVPGTFAYSPPAGTVLNVGAGQTLSVIFTPTDATHYTTATASTILNVVPHACDLSETTLGAAVVGGNMEMYFTNRYGLSAVEGLTLINSIMTGTAYGPGLGSGVSVGAITLNDKLALPVGTTNLTIVAVKVNPLLSATVNARVYDNCGNGRQFDPVLAQVTVAAAGEVRQFYSGIPAAEHYVCVANGNPGLNRVKLVVNGRTFEVNPLEDGKAWVVDVRAAMNEGKQNTVVLIGWGVPGASADLQISDRAIGTLLALTAQVERPVLSLVRNGDQVVLSWLGPANFFTLEASDSFGAVWQAVSAAQEETEGSTTARTSVQNGKTFFRLRQ